MAYDLDASRQRRREGFQHIGRSAAQHAAKRQALEERIRREMEQEMGTEEREAATDWHSRAGQGAAIGGMFSPIGMGIGAGAGALFGIAGATKRRMDEGRGLGGALWDTVRDFKPLTSGRALSAAVGPAMMAARMGYGKMGGGGGRMSAGSTAGSAIRGGVAGAGSAAEPFNFYGVDFSR